MKRLLNLTFPLLLLIASHAFGETANDTATSKPVTNSTNPKVELRTDLGVIVIELFPKEAPLTVENFLTYIDKGFYNGTIFHRVIPGFVVQGGGLTYDFQQKPTLSPIKNESDNGLKNTMYTLSMARTSNPDSATSQFFINVNNNEHLDPKGGRPGYAVFAKVIEGEHVLQKIVKEPRGLYKQHPEAPNFPVRILSSKRL